MKKIIFFDCDGTLWSCKSQEYISRVLSKLKIDNRGILIREKDCEEFMLRGNVKRVLQKLKNMGYILGIISDNNYKQTMQAVELLGLKNFFDTDMIVIDLYDGPCNKVKMMLDNPLFKKKEYSEINLIDDKNYIEQCQKEGIHYIHAKNNQTTLFDDLKFMFSSSKSSTESTFYEDT